MKPPFGRFGGKRLLALKIINLFPNNYDIFVEPFLGAGNIFFRLKQNPDIKEVINDKDVDVIKIMKLLKNRGDWVDKNIQRKYSKTYFDKIKDKTDALSTLEKIKMSFFSNGRTFNTTKEGDTIKTDFTKYKDRLKDTVILNQDFSTVIKKYDSPNTFFYLDPPYESEEQLDYKDYVNPEEVYDAIKNIKGKFLLSYNDSPNIRDIFKKYNITTIKTIYQQTKQIKPRYIKELLIKNY